MPGAAVGHVTRMSEPAPTPPAPDDLPVPQAEPPIDPVPGRDPATVPLDGSSDLLDDPAAVEPPG